MTLRPRDRVALGVLAALALIGAFYLLALKPEQHKAGALAAQIASQRRSLATAQAQYAAGRAAQASLRKHEREWAALGLAVPARSDIPGLLRDLERNARAVGVKMQAVALGGGSAGSPSSATSPSAATAVPGAASDGSTSTATGIPIQLTFQGGYVALDKLVRRLDGMVEVSGSRVRATGPLLSIGNVSLSGSPLTVQLTASIYQLAPAPSTDGTTGTTASTGG